MAAVKLYFPKDDKRTELDKEREGLYSEVSLIKVQIKEYKFRKKDSLTNRIQVQT